ncbi:orotidine-5'-phosphate decarboxylase [Porphyromonas endodontalis]|uniref:Orotidine 5'-phosphate decarboxylase n=1 Tax=Porphyromonas endodontalis (strain ATCC 35406 / DSM 24491 / JCM 8526 / CCUG 16442 / BCRC 14492 / NCTC 13058 / HG 370) TaxID=553175 RepID=C3JC64_POREA|nr:orotidine-5'-phosphate decarboxylase [Porphyromonas endodontalis]EEN82270.1 orotidine 5'-phosphate decarboxylase [Porphyromonas endodontalis ATCC 35406]UBH63956.1 orotidine-5'-phosphate decarboxylase [Porphyromonas endodontalis]SUB67792.1 orotidine 5'-phosphate decarboxylase [Porphyromonas endodontalis]
MTRQELIENIKRKRSFLCVGLDTDLRKIPEHLMRTENPMLTFNRAIIDATAGSCVAYKPNVAFYESMGAFGVQVLEHTVAYIREQYPDQFIIIDGKRGDIGNTGMHYARSSYEYLKADALTVAPYMGQDSVKPFLEYKDKWVVLLALTSNQGASDFQLTKNEEGDFFFEQVLKTSSQWSDDEHMMYVVGATQAEYLQRVRNIVPNHFLLVPGIGAQGGDFDQLIEHGMTPECGLLVNSSRGILYADSSEHFASAAANEAENLRRKMETALIKQGII